MELITGGAGFLGSALARALVAEGRRVRVFDDLSRGHPRRLGGLGVDLVTGDVRDAGALRVAARGCTTLWHLAAVNGTRHFYERPDEVLEIGVRGTLNAVDAALAEGVARVVFTSSSEVYAEPPVVPTPEDVRLEVPELHNPRFSYGGSKIAGELWMVHVAARRGLETVIVRPHNVYGPDMGSDHVVPQFVRKLLPFRERGEREATLAVEGDGRQTRAFCYVDDAARGLMLAGTLGASGCVYHLGNPEAVTMAELAARIGRCLGLEVHCTSAPLPRGSTPRRCPDVSRLAALGYVPRVSLDDGLRRTVEWHLSQA